MDLFKLLILSAGHMVTDVSQGAIPIIITHLKESMNLTYTQATAIFLASNITSSFVQPVFGVISDRYRMLWLMPAGIMLSAIGIAFTGVVPSYLMVLSIILITGLGVAGYHPEASKATHFLSYGPKKASAMSIFSVGGNVGIGIGPLLATWFIAMAGLKGTLYFLIPGLVMTIIMIVILPQLSEMLENDKQLDKNNNTKISHGVVPFSSLVLLVIVVIIRSWIHAGLLNFIPLYFIDYMEGNEFYGGMLLTVFLIAGAVGTLLGGPIADHIGPKKVICWSMALSLPLTYLIFNSQGIWNLIFTALDGAVIICTFGVTVVFGQKLMPHNIGLASGLLLGFAIGTGGFGATFLGYIADNWSIHHVIKIIYLLPAVGTLLAFFLPKPEDEYEVQLESKRLQ